jgi:hypothetical protein
MEPLIAFGLLGAAKLIYDAIGDIDEAEQRIIARYRLGARLEALEAEKIKRQALMGSVQQQTASQMLAAMRRRTR